MRWNPHGQAAIMVAVLTCLLGAVDLNVSYFPDPPQPPTMFAPRVDGEAPVLDGKLDDPVWKKAVVIESLPSREGAAASVRTTVRLCYDTHFIYIAFDAQEPALDKVSITAKPGSDDWPDNCVEVFLDPRRTKQVFYQFITNHQDVHNDYGAGQDVKWNGKWTSKAGLDEDGWVTEFAIPFTDFGYDKAPTGGEWGLNLTRERILVGEAKTVSSELMSWASIGTFTAVSEYGVLVFGTAEEYVARVPTIKLRAAVDRYAHSTLNPLAQVAVNFDLGRAQGSSVLLRLLRDGVEKPVGEWTVKDIQTTRFGIDLPIQGLPEGGYRVTLTATGSNGRTSNTVESPFNIRAPAQKPADKGFFRITQAQPMTRSVDAWHVRTGVPMPEGALWDASKVTLVDEQNRPVPVQTRTLATWSKGGSIKWLSLDFPSTLGPTALRNYRLRYGPAESANTAGPMTVRETADAIEINTGVARFNLRRKGFNLIDRLWIGDRQIVDTGDARGPYMVDEAGTTFWASADPASSVIVEEQGPLMTIVRAEGAHISAGKSLGRYVLRLYFYGGMPYCRVQHTFIITEDTKRTRYNDIGVLFPFTGDNVTFGLPRKTADPAGGVGQFSESISADASISLVQRSWDRFDIQRNASAGPQRVLDSDKAPGWFARGQTAVLVRDFWQNFPKELEATRDGLIVHAWPGHGENIVDMAVASTPLEVWRLWFAHQGKLLDFNIPGEYYNETMMKEYGFGEAGGSYGPPAKKANALGLGKTHDMLFAFGDAAEPGKVAALHEAFDKGVHLLPDPAWTCATNVAGELHPQDPTRFTVAEDYYSAGFDYLMNMTLTLNRAYGMFNYGDSFTHVKTYTPNQEPGYYRLWAGYHHGRARVPWLLYMRSGDPKYLAWGRANAAHLADVDTCHYTTPFFASHPDEEARKYVGGMCDYKGTVHWNTGFRTGEYNSQMDFLMYNYYLTGDRRMWDVLLEAGPCAVEHGHTAPERHGGGCLSAWIDYYKATWDPRALLAIVNGFPRMYTIPARNHFPPSISWAPYLEPWITMTGDPVATKFMLDFTDWAVQDPNTREAGGEGLGGSTRAHALAYRLTGNDQFLRKAWAFTNQGPTLYQWPGDNLSGGVDWYVWSYNTQQTLYALRPVADRGGFNNVTQIPYDGTGPSTVYHYRDEKQQQVMTIFLPEKTDGAFRVGGRFGSYTDVKYQFIAPDGKVLREGVIPKPPDDSYKFEFNQEADGQTGVYKLTLSSHRPYKFWYSWMCTLRTQRFAVPEKGDPYPAFTGDGRWYFRVPEDSEQFSITARAHPDSRVRSSFTIFTPEDQPYRSLSLQLAGPDGSLTIEPPRKFRGKVWSIALNQPNIIDVDGIPRWFAAFPEGAE